MASLATLDEGTTLIDHIFLHVPKQAGDLAIGVELSTAPTGLAAPITNQPPLPCLQNSFGQVILKADPASR